MKICGIVNWYIKEAALQSGKIFGLWHHPTEAHVLTILCTLGNLFNISVPPFSQL